MENIFGKKIELLPCKLKENQIHCSVCSGIGWLQAEGYLKLCPHCSNGAINVCPECGKPYKTRYIRRCENPKCVENYERKQRIKEVEEEQKRLDKAVKIESDNIFDKFTMLYTEYYGYNEGYFSDWDSFFEDWHDYVYYVKDDDCEDDLPMCERPEYVWGTSCQSISLDAESIIEQACDDLWEGARDNCDYDSLQKALDKWCNDQNGTETYWVDYKYAVKIPWELY